MENKEDLNDYKSAYKTEFKFYDENHWYLKQYADLMLNTIKRNRLKNILSLGIGHNVVSNMLVDSLSKKQIEKYHIVEGSPEIILDFKNKHIQSEIEVFESYFENFNSDIKYDAIEMGFILEHVDNPFEIIKQFKQFLSPNGIIFISVPNAKSLHRLIGNKAGLLDDIYKLSQYDLELGHKRYFDLEKIEQLIIESGLRIINRKGLMLKPITGDQLKILNWGENIISALMLVGLDYPEIANCIYIETSL